MVPQSSEWKIRLDPCPSVHFHLLHIGSRLSYYSILKKEAAGCSKAAVACYQQKV